MAKLFCKKVMQSTRGALKYTVGKEYPIMDAYMSGYDMHVVARDDLGIPTAFCADDYDFTRSFTIIGKVEIND